MKIRKIIHIDMDAFYASVEQRDNPAYRGHPVIVGGDPKKRGVVATCSYEARKFGIHSAMPSKTAYQLCPQAIFVFPKMDVYKQVSDQIRAIFYEYTYLVEPLSLDEAYLDVTANKRHLPTAAKTAREILTRIYDETHLTASAGVSYNKLLAKIASDYRKPNGLTVIPPEKAEAFIAALPIRKFFGVGKVTEQKMLKIGIYNGTDLGEKSLEELSRCFGKSGRAFYNYAKGIDERPVEPARIRKSMGQELTFDEDILAMAQIENFLKSIAEKVSNLLDKHGKQGLTVTLKVKYYDFVQKTRALTLDHPIFKTDDIMQVVNQLIPKTELGKKKVRLLGLSMSGLREKELNSKG